MIVISLFTGIGGFEIGFHDNNVEVTKHLEIDEKCCETINSNSKFLNRTKYFTTMNSYISCSVP